MSSEDYKSKKTPSQGDTTLLEFRPRSREEVDKALGLIHSAIAGIEYVWKPRAAMEQDFRQLALLETELMGLYIAAKAIKWSLGQEANLFDFGKVAEYIVPEGGVRGQ